MSDLSVRQKQLLKSVIEIYVKNGEPVGSESVEKHFNLGVSPATIRNEMVRLTDMGFLKQPHTSAGRVPTSVGYRLYIAELMKEKEMPVLDEVTIRQRVLDQRPTHNKMLNEATKSLAKSCGTLALAWDDDGDLYYAGAANILDMPEFFDIDVARFVLSLFDEHPILKRIMETARGSDPLHIVFGEETEFAHLSTTSFAFLKYGDDNSRTGVIGVVGPARLNFPVVIPYLRYIGGILTEAERFA